MKIAAPNRVNHRRQFTRDWEARMNHYLSSGTALSGKQLV